MISNADYPVIVLVGRPNVGKSTLFNCLTKTRQALVADFPGLTRDRQYGDARFQDKTYIVIDTGGIGVEDAVVDQLMSQQTQYALLSADLIFFVVDARAGLMASDERIAKQLRTMGKPVYIVVNKIDGCVISDVILDFYRLGFATIYPISAAHDRGINALLTHALQPFPVSAVTSRLAGIHIAIVGRPNVGKSTFINRILKQERVLVGDAPGTTRDSIFIPFQHGDTPYVLIDTAGVRRRGRIDSKIEKFAVIKTLQAIAASQVCVMMIDAKEGVTEQDSHLLGMILERGTSLVILINKWDGLSTTQKLHIKQMIARKWSFLFKIPIQFVSALHGQGLSDVFKAIQRVYAASTKSFSTADLTRVLTDIIAQHPPPLVKGKHIQFKYAHIGGHHPVIVVVHGRRLDQLPLHYKRYLNHAFIEHFNLVGTIVQFKYK